MSEAPRKGDARPGANPPDCGTRRSGEKKYHAPSEKPYSGIALGGAALGGLVFTGATSASAAT